MDKINLIRNRVRTLFFISYGIILLIIVIYSYTVLKVNKVDVLAKLDPVVAEVEKRPVKVTLLLDINGTKTTLIYNLYDDEPVINLLKAARREGKLDYEVTEYTTGLVIAEVNAIKPAASQKWVVLQNGVDITKDIGKLRLLDNSSYTLSLAK